MAAIRGILAQTSNLFTGTGTVDHGPSSTEDEVSTKKMQRLPDSVFEDISRNLEATLQNKDWANRPRTWYILNQINRLDLMETFILQGLNDTSLPYNSRQSLPQKLDRFEYENFVKWQDAVLSDVLQLEKGSHVLIKNGNALFEGRRIRLGTGSQGSSLVEKVTSKMTGKVYARKIINKSQRFGHDEDAKETYEREIKTLRKPELEGNDHLIKIKGTYSDKKYFAMLLDPVADRNLKQYMNENAISLEQEKNRFRTYFGCLAHTIRFLHGLGITHKDIKPENVLLKNGHLILTDFGTAFDWSLTNQSMTRSNADDKRTPRYQSPEVANAGEFRRASDIWSLGVLFLEMVTVLHGRSLAEMDEFIQNHGTRRTHAFENLEGTTSWLGPLRATTYGSVLDNEPIAWIQQMLSRECHSRHSAETLYDTITAFSIGQFCGRCCLENDLDSDSDVTSESGTLMFSDIMEENQEHLGTFIVSKLPPVAESGPQQPVLFELPTYKALSGPSVPGSGHENAQTNDSHMKHSRLKKSNSRARRKSSVVSAIDHTSGIQASSPALSEGLTLATAQMATINKKNNATNKSKPFPGKEGVIQWLYTTAKKFKSPTPVRNRRSSRKCNSTVESQQIGHFLSTLPDEIGDYEVTHDNLIGDDEPFLTSRSQTCTDVNTPSLRRSQSHEDWEPAHKPEEVEDETYVTDSLFRLVHYASDTHLPLTQMLPKEDRHQTIKDLQDFAASTPKLVARKEFDPMAHHSAPKSRQDVVCSCEDEGSESNSQLAKKEINGTNDTISQMTANDPRTSTDEKSHEINLEEIRGPGVEHLKRREGQNLAIDQNSSTRLGEWISGKNPKGRRLDFESATMIMERILETKTAEAPTTIMSTNTKAMFYGGRRVTRWNDEFYGYLNFCVFKGNAPGVRELLRAGCNPGTLAKPRPYPIFKAVRNTSDSHIKCLRALVEYGVDVNYKEKNGRRPIHYAIEQVSWSGYSTVIYILLSAGANPNVEDNAGDKPLLMLLTGNGPLLQQQRDALFLLLAPNFNTNLDISVLGTLDNPLHLVVRRKDAYATDAILEKMKRDGEPTMSLLHARNGTGFTPLLLAFSVFTLSGEVSEELRIIKLLLQNHANPDDQDIAKGETCLYRVIKEFKNAVALELLCRYKANPNIASTAGESPLRMVTKSLEEHPDDLWHLFAKRRMEDNLKDEDYRPPELVDYLNEEREVAG
ncbi:MAG: hypothetical protein Q9167_003703 [Letrouitia subvulpina]